MLSKILIVALVLIALPAQADVVTINDNGLQGWWSNLMAPNVNQHARNNYFTGHLSYDDNVERRGYFTFNLTGISQTISAATLQIHLRDNSSFYPSETVNFFDVTTNSIALNTAANDDGSTFIDLGTGKMYGSITVPIPSPVNVILQIPLNSDAISDLNASRGSFFSVGAALAVIHPANRIDEFVFGTSDAFTNDLLLTVPEPSTLTLLMLCGLCAWASRRHN